MRLCPKHPLAKLHRMIMTRGLNSFNSSHKSSLHFFVYGSPLCKRLATDDVAVDVPVISEYLSLTNNVLFDELGGDDDCDSFTVKDILSR